MGGQTIPPIPLVPYHRGLIPLNPNVRLEGVWDALQVAQASAAFVSV
jgi:hypothetical protein